jgi:hypothetical protein
MIILAPPRVLQSFPAPSRRARQPAPTFKPSLVMILGRATGNGRYYLSTKPALCGDRLKPEFAAPWDDQANRDSSARFSPGCG